jgi:predicted RNase H-like HicB family nuclease
LEQRRPGFRCRNARIAGLHGETQEAALANVKEAMELWLDIARRHGDEIPQPKGRLMVA